MLWQSHWWDHPGVPSCPESQNCSYLRAQPFSAAPQLPLSQSASALPSPAYHSLSEPWLPPYP